MAESKTAKVNNNNINIDDFNRYSKSLNEIENDGTLEFAKQIRDAEKQIENLS